MSDFLMYDFFMDNDYAFSEILCGFEWIHLSYWLSIIILHYSIAGKYKKIEKSDIKKSDI